MVPIFRPSTIVIFLWILNSFPSLNIKNELVLDRVELINATYLEGLYNISEMRVGKFNRTTYVLNFEIESFIEINQKDSEFETTFYFNRMNNNQYSKTLIHVRRSPLRSTMDTFRTLLFPDAMRTHSNLPVFNGPNASFCPIPKVQTDLIWLKQLYLKFVFSSLRENTGWKIILSMVVKLRHCLRLVIGKWNQLSTIAVWKSAFGTSILKWFHHFWTPYFENLYWSKKMKIYEFYILKLNLLPPSAEICLWHASRRFNTFRVSK